MNDPHSMPAVDGDDYVFPMSFAQQRLWFLAQLEPDSPFYNIPLAVRLTGMLDVQAVRFTFEELVRRHEVLRTTFTLIDGQPVQIIRPGQPLPFTVQECGDCSEEEQAAILRRLATEEARACFDLTTGPLLRVTLLRMNERQHVLLMIIHHIVFDRWSADVLIRDFAQGYAALSGKPSDSGPRPVSLPPLPVQYADFAQWQRERLHGDRLDRALTYWKKQLADAPTLLELPTDRPRPAMQSYRGARYAFSLPAGLTAGLTALSRRHGATLFMTLLAAFQILLFRYTREADFCVGTPVANRSRLELEGLIGFFVNTLVLRADVSDDLDFLALLARVREVVLGAQAHQDLPFEHVVEALQPARHLSHAPLFQVMFTLQTPSPTLPSLPGLALDSLPLDHGITQFDLSLEMSVECAGLCGIFEYGTDLFDEGTIARMASHFQTLLEGIVAEPKTRIADLPLLSAEERQQLLIEWNAPAGAGLAAHQSTITAACPQRCLHELFEDQVQRTPDAIAVLADGRSVTYAALNGQADRLADALRRRGVGPEERVGLCVERSPDMLVGLLGILKAGGAYVPLDPAYPRERLAHILEDARVRLVVTQHRLAADLPIAPNRTMCLDRDWPLTAQEETIPPACTVGPDNAAYLIYTSGSTGQPKGVVISHGAAVNYVMRAADAFRLSQSDRVLQFASISFDASAEEIYPTLGCGATLVLRTDQMIESVSTFMQTCQDWGITVLDLPTMYWHEITARLGTELRGIPPSVRLVIIGGEEALSERVRIWNQYAGDTTLLNTYGPTETTIVATLCQLSGGNADPLRQVSIGRPIPNAQAYVLDESGHPLPIGVPGELYIGGAGVARGYWRRPELTAERFVPDPFSREPGARLYRTGDRVRYRADGNIEYWGRLDRQVKLRGFRIELGEIEAQLREHPRVQEAIVQVREDRPGHKRLVAYVAAGEGEAPGTEAVRRHLQARLPDYMVPSAIVWLSRLPLTPNGKVDRRTLPVPEEPGSATRPPVAPRTPTEQRLAEIWAQVVGRSEIGIHDNFFELGGDSILSLQVVARAREAGLVLTPRQLFQHQTVAQLAAVAGRSPATGALPTATQGLVAGPVPMTPIQQWFFEQAVPNPHHWNQSVLLEVRRPLVVAALEAATAAVVRQHDALRLRFTADDGVWRQEHAAVSDEPLMHREDLSTVPADERRAAMESAANRWQASLHLDMGPLMRIVWFDTGAAESRLLLVVHHLVIDGVSWRILLEDLQTAYQQVIGGQPIRLPAKTTSFQQWAAGLQAAASSAAVQQEAGYWRAVQDAMVPGLPVEAPGGSRTEAVAQTVAGALSEADTQALLQRVPAAYRTQILEVLLTALVQTLGAWIDRDELIVALEGHGRETLSAELDVSRTIGWFTSLYPVVLTLPRGTGAREALQTIKEQMRRIPNRGIGYGLLRYGAGASDVARPLWESPTPPVCFNYLGQFDQTFDDGAAWAFTRESVGREHDPKAALPYEIEVNAAVVGGRLEVSWTYSGARYRRETIEALSARYLAALQDLIAHCLIPDVGGYTPSDFPLAMLDQPSLDRLILDHVAGRQRELDDLYPLTPLQHGVLFHTLYTPHSGAYLEQVSCTLEGPLDVQAFVEAWRRIVETHAVLRTGFCWEGLDAPLQVVYRQVDLPLLHLDWRGLAAVEQRSRFEALLATDRRTDFVLSAAPLMRLTLIRTEERSWHFLWSHHHILLDGWCVPLILKDVFASYAAGAGRDASDMSRPRPYRDYVAWLGKLDLVAAERYWRTALAGLRAPTPLIVDQSAEPITEDEPGYGAFVLRLSHTRTTHLQAFAQNHQLTLNTVVQGAWALLLNRYSGEEDVLFGATVSGRSATVDGIETMVGLVINTVPVRVTVPSDQTVLPWLKELFARNVELREHEHTPLTHIQRWSDIARGQALFESVVVFENYPLDRTLEQSHSGVAVRNVRCDDQTNYPLTVNVHPGPELIVRLSYDRRRFDAVTMERLAGHLEQVLHALCTQPHARLSELSVTTASERRTLVTEWNATSKVYPQERCVHEVIEAQAERTPEAIAVVFGEERLTYKELNVRANQLARYLRHQGIRPGMLVGVCLERSVEMVVALLGILKAGAAYVPIDPDYPSERIAFMLHDADTPVLLTQAAVAGRLPAHKCSVLCLDRDWSEIAQEPGRKLDVTLSLQHLAYTIYTSGSTGRPKGAGVPHAGLLNRLLWMQEQYGLSADDRVLQKTPFSFDVSVWEFFWPLLAGACLVVAAPGEHKNAPRLVELIVEEQVTTLHFVPPMLQAFLDTPGVDRCRSLRRVLCSGEALPLELQRRFFQRLSAGLHNLYGPTEASIDVTAWACRSEERASSVPIGRPIANTEIYLLDRQGHPAPIGVPGELYIGGVGLARGYHRRPDLTAEKFVPDPFSPVPGGRLYRTGDLARYRPDGAIEFLGRLDHQVKIRGFRIELGEIEAWLNRHPSVRESVVLAREDHPGVKRLVAYAVRLDGAAPDGQELREWLAEQLPDYMVPAMIVILDALPLTPNGKVDRRALPVPDAATQLTTHYVAPRTTAEQVLADIWADVLHVERVGVNDDFFELGGDSIISLQIIARAHQSGLRLTPKQLFEHPTVGRAAAVATLQAATVSTPDADPAGDPEARLTDEELNNLLEEMK